MIESDLHDQILMAFRDYVIENEKWETEQNFLAGSRARNALGKIRILGRKRRIEIQNQRKELLKKRKEKRLLKKGKQDE